MSALAVIAAALAVWFIIACLFWVLCASAGEDDDHNGRGDAYTTTHGRDMDVPRIPRRERQHPVSHKRRNGRWE